MLSKLTATAAAIALFAATPVLAQTTQPAEERLPAAGAEPTGDLGTDATRGVTDLGQESDATQAGSGGSGQIVDGQQAGTSGAVPVEELDTEATRGVTDAGNEAGANQAGSGGTGQITYGEQRAPGAEIEQGSGAIGSGQDATVGAAGPAATADYDWYDRGEGFQGEIAGGYTADELMGSEVVNRQGEDIGEIEDLAVSEDGQVSHVLVDVSGLFESERFVLVDLAELQRSEGDEGQFVLDRDASAIEALPRYTRGDGDSGWASWTGMD